MDFIRVQDDSIREQATRYSMSFLFLGRYPAGLVGFQAGLKLGLGILDGKGWKTAVGMSFSLLPGPALQYKRFGLALLVEPYCGVYWGEMPEHVVDLSLRFTLLLSYGFR